MYCILWILSQLKFRTYPKHIFLSPAVTSRAAFDGRSDLVHISLNLLSNQLGHLGIRRFNFRFCGPKMCIFCLKSWFLVFSNGLRGRLTVYNPFLIVLNTIWPLKVEKSRSENFSKTKIETSARDWIAFYPRCDPGIASKSNAYRNSMRCLPIANVVGFGTDFTI